MNFFQTNFASVGKGALGRQWSGFYSSLSKWGRKGNFARFCVAKKVCRNLLTKVSFPCRKTSINSFKSLTAQGWTLFFEVSPQHRRTALGTPLFKTFILQTQVLHRGGKPLGKGNILTPQKSRQNIVTDMVAKIIGIGIGLILYPAQTMLLGILLDFLFGKVQKRSDDAISFGGNTAEPFAPTAPTEIDEKSFHIILQVMGSCHQMILCYKLVKELVTAVVGNGFQTALSRKFFPQVKGSDGQRNVPLFTKSADKLLLLIRGGANAVVNAQCRQGKAQFGCRIFHKMGQHHRILPAGQGNSDIGFSVKKVGKGSAKRLIHSVAPNRKILYFHPTSAVAPYRLNRDGFWK